MIRRQYLILYDGLYSLRESARLLNEPEEELRRSILMDELPATDTSDDRQYLLRGSDLQGYVRRLRPLEEPVLEGDCSGVVTLMAFLLLPILLSAGLAISTPCTFKGAELPPPASISRPVQPIHPPRGRSRAETPPRVLPPPVSW